MKNRFLLVPVMAGLLAVSALPAVVNVLSSAPSTAPATA